ncbi:hypothetical protein GCM10020358_52450 [Amorphoplanes nipponensis]|uniref:Uncharacterized protein n=1 Tax=Actinoplanes nipponensis TaxID=135950 RepID=A0A919JH99_9ACTN|nr:hypothetical protein [Actinoplanes nipponensis]GIE49613.1 hypothetical protein Ani05nite_31470 [Actinoplanes nipponensis]
MAAGRNSLSAEGAELAPDVGGAGVAAGWSVGAVLVVGGSSDAVLEAGCLAGVVLVVGGSSGTVLMSGRTTAGAISAAAALTVAAAFLAGLGAFTGAAFFAGLDPGWAAGLAGSVCRAAGAVAGWAGSAAWAGWDGRRVPGRVVFAGATSAGVALVGGAALRGWRFAGAVRLPGASAAGGGAAEGWGAEGWAGEGWAGEGWAGEGWAAPRGADFAGFRRGRGDGVASGDSAPVPEEVLSPAGGRKVTAGGAFAGLAWGVGWSGVLNAGFDVRGRRCFGSFSSMPRQPSRAPAVSPVGRRRGRRFP